THPGSDTFEIGALFALANAVIYGSVTAAVRGMTATESAETLTLWQLALITGFFACLLPLGVKVPTLSDAGLITFNGIIYGLGRSSSALRLSMAWLYLIHILLMVKLLLLIF